MKLINATSKRFSPSVFLVTLVMGALTAAAEEPKLADLTPPQYQALERASVASVTATISFLASDELAGRGTPSRELDIAAAYVASRLRGAGAQGLGPDGSYYLTSTLNTVRVPSGCELRIEDHPTPAVRLLEAGEQAVDYSGRAALLGDDGKLPGGWTGPVVCIAPPDASASRRSPLSALFRPARVASSHGAPALLVLVGRENPLWALAENYQRNARVDSARARMPLPIVLVQSDVWPDQAAFHLVTPAIEKGATPVRNVIGILRGSDPQLAQEAILFSAHLDHLGRVETGEDPIFNGADDDASGVTAVLTLADVYGALPERPKRSVVFMTFWGEERGLMGSRAFVQDPAWPLDKIVANINIEMVGRPEEGARHKCWMTGWGESDLGRLMAAGSRRVGVEVFEHPRYSARLYQASDNWPFVQKGVVAHSFSAGSLHQDYHQPSDEWEKLDLPHMTQVVRGLFAGSLAVAQGAVTPHRTTPPDSQGQ